MAPKRKPGGKVPDIRNFFGKDDNVPGSSSSTPGQKPKTVSQMHQLSLKEEDVSEGGHPHYFEIKFNQEVAKQTIECINPCTVMEAIESHVAQKFDKKNISAENILIKLGEKDNSPIVATHFPCCCIEKDVCLVIYTSKKVVEVPKQRELKIYPKEQYSLFYIDKEGGKDTKSKSNQIFRCTNLRNVKFGYYCVYGEKKTTVEDALRQDGRFHDDLVSFSLSDKNKTETITKSTETVAGLHLKEFMICLPKEKTDPRPQTRHKQQEQRKTACASNVSQSEIRIQSVLKVAQQESISIRRAMEERGIKVDLNEIHQLLCRQYPDLKKLMEERFPGQSFKKILNLKKEDFGKIQHSFSEVHRVRELLNLSESICRLEINENSSSLSQQGTGFVLFDNFILTNAHLFNPWLKKEIENWWEYLKITANFYFESPDNKLLKTFPVRVIGGTHHMDYCLLELICENQSSDQTKIPPGLLKRFGPVPSDDGGACIIGHPAGGVKKMDITCVIRPEERDGAVEQNLQSHKDGQILSYSVNQGIKKNPYADIYVTYNSFMYHGSSGSPVFDACGYVFGLHSGGFFFNWPKPGESVLEYAFPLLKIFEQLLKNAGGMEGFLARVQEEAKGNMHLEKIIASVQQQNKNQTQVGENQNKREEHEFPQSHLGSEVSGSEEPMEIN